MTNVQFNTLPAGTLLSYNGLPLMLASDTEVQMGDVNLRLAQEFEANQTDRPLLEIKLTEDVLEIKSDPDNPKLAVVFKGFKENGITVKHVE